jgi:hypothetical protein
MSSTAAKIVKIIRRHRDGLRGSGSGNAEEFGIAFSSWFMLLEIESRRRRYGIVARASPRRSGDINW